MGDQAEFSDDISALWGPNTGMLQPAATRRVAPQSHPPTPHSNGSAAPDHLDAIEKQLEWLAGAIQSGQFHPGEHLEVDALTQLHLDLAEQLGQVRSDLPAESAARLDASEARTLAQITDLAMRFEERIAQVDAERREETGRVAAAIEAHEYQPVGKHRARKVGEELCREFAHELSATRAAVEERFERRLAEVQDELTRRGEAAVAEAASATGECIAGLERQMAELADAVRALRIGSVELQARVRDGAGDSRERLGQLQTVVDVVTALGDRLTALEAAARAVNADPHPMSPLADVAEGARAAIVNHRIGLLEKWVEAVRDRSVGPADRENLRSKIEGAAKASAEADAQLAQRVDDLTMPGMFDERLRALEQRIAALGEPVHTARQGADLEASIADHVAAPQPSNEARVTADPNAASGHI